MSVKREIFLSLPRYLVCSKVLVLKIPILIHLVNFFLSLSVVIVVIGAVLVRLHKKWMQNDL